MTEAEIEHRKTIFAKYNRAKHNDMFFKSENYEWELGASIAHIYRTAFDNDKTILCYGIPVRINFYDVGKIELWKKVE